MYSNEQEYNDAMAAQAYAEAEQAQAEAEARAAEEENRIEQEIEDSIQKQINESRLLDKNWQ